VKFLLKKERVFFFGVLPSKYSGSVAGRNADSVLPKLFSGGKNLAKPRLNFPPAGGVWGGMRAGLELGVFGNSAATKLNNIS
jgi:hypothetical protein